MSVTTQVRHPELVSGSLFLLICSIAAVKNEIPKQVRDDTCGFMLIHLGSYL